ENCQFSDIAFLYRNNYLSMRIEQELIAQKIPYEILGAFKFIERGEIKDVLAFLRTILYQDNLSLLRVLNLMEGIGAQTKTSNPREREKNVQQFLNVVQNKKLIKTRNNLILSSIHQAKGLEFEIVFFVYLDEGTLPYKENKDLIEEKRLFYVEVVHTDTFVYCCDSLGLNPDEIYNMYQTIPSIEEKDVFVVELTKSILDPQFRVNNELPTLEKLEKEIKELEKEIEKNPNKEQKDELEKKRKNKEKVLLRHEHNIKLFLHNLIGYYVIMEGIFFYAGFAMMLALKRVNKMVGIGQQFEYIMRDESLHLAFAVELEKKYALDACPEGIAGINSEQFTTDLNKEKNFFETRPTEYQTGSSLKWDEEEEKNSQGKN
ncbi:7274_t:CDS:2, partial [Entrophospora sp. SA101]